MHNKREWVYENVYVLETYIANSPLCAVAQHSDPNNLVMPTLLSIFTRRSFERYNTLDPDSTRAKLLHGLNEEKLILSELIQIKQGEFLRPIPYYTSQLVLERTYELELTYKKEYYAIQNELFERGLISRRPIIGTQ
jgi:hypothetical protein